ncbi:ferritin [Geomonas limicola]|uniref:Ferritin n=1 Tax=Geomonas limicola TaxID=2740186 RepID=A0A6V8NB54_9BACT|nr:ferritin family protein [Geomonas limicola]GFO69731.1 ferritin [Geomonas limicola]
MNLIDYALQMEADGRDYYHRLAAETDSRELRTLFTLLAEAEQAHYDALKERRVELGGGEGSGIVEQAKNIFQTLLAQRELDQTPTPPADPDAYRLAIRAEEEAIAYYNQAAEEQSSAELRQLLLHLAAEEKLHLNIIENIYEFVESPKYFLEWGEFSNLKEL